MSGEEVTLSWMEVWTAAVVGIARHIACLKNGLRDKHGFHGDGWGAHIEGAAGEMAFAKYLGVYWPGTIGTFKAPDVGDVQVRTRSRDEYELIVREDDPSDSVFVLVVGRAPRYRVAGWIRGSDAKCSEYLAAHGGRELAYFVPNDRLRGVGEIAR